MGEVIRFPGAGGAGREAVPRSAVSRPEPPRPVEPRGVEPLWREVVGDVLREERRDTERTLVDVAGEAGISTQYLSEIERGRKEPSSEVLSAVAGALGLRLGELTIRVTRRLASYDGLCLAAA